MRLARVAVVVASVAALWGTASAAPGQLDPSFGSGGKVVTMFPGGSAYAYALGLQPNGRAVAVGERYRRRHTDGVIARYDTRGRLDRTFGRGGKVLTPLGTDVALVSSVAFQRDRRILVAGGAAPGKSVVSRFLLVRYLPNGSIDHRFGSRGIARTAFGTGFAAALAVAVQPDGKIVAAGFVRRRDGFAQDIALARYNRYGTLDRSFGDRGRVITTLASDSGAAEDLVIQPDGRILVSAGWFGSDGLAGEYHGFVVLRYRADGTLDPSFGANGIVSTVVGSGGAVLDVSLQRNGKIVVGGSTLGSFTDVCCDPEDFAVARYLPNGTLDPSFGSSGIVTTPIGEPARVTAVALRRDGGIVAAGTSVVRDGGFFVAVYRNDGTLDTRFGRNGLIRTPFGGRLMGANAVEIQSNGKIVAAGTGLNGRRTHTGFALVRYLSR